MLTLTPNAAECWNPVRANMVARPRAQRWSSYAINGSGKASDWYATAYALLKSTLTPTPNATPYVHMSVDEAGGQVSPARVRRAPVIPSDSEKRAKL